MRETEMEVVLSKKKQKKIQKQMIMIEIEAWDQKN